MRPASCKSLNNKKRFNGKYNTKKKITIIFKIDLSSKNDLLVHI